MTENFPNLVKKIDIQVYTRHTRHTRSTDNPKQDEPKEAQTKTQHN